MLQTNPLFLLPEFKDNYQKKVELGKEYAQNKKIIVTGLTRNNESKLETNINIINSVNKNIEFFLYENDSSDNTKNILKSLNSKICNIKYKSESLNLKAFGQVKNKERTINLAKHRNKCLSYVKNHYQNSDYVIVIDLDFDVISLDGIYHSFGLFNENKKIHGIAGFSYEIKHTKDNQTILWNYDSWAFRINWWEDLQKYYINYGTDPMYWFGWFKPPIGSDPIIVNSAFGGCCIYKTEKFINGEYSGEDCEHVMFHKNLSANFEFNLVANPAQIMIFK